MTVLSGFEDLRPKKVLAISGGKALVEGVENNMDVYVSPSGGIFLQHPEPVPIDQIGEEPKKSMAEKWASSGIDQPV